MWTAENRPHYDRSKLRYPSDLTDAEWSLIAPLIPPAKRGGNKRTVDERAVVQGLLYILSSGCQWRAIARPQQVLKARDGRLRTQRSSIRQAPEGEFEGRVVAQAVGVIGVLVAGGNHQHAKTQDVGHAVDDALWRARISDAGGQAVGDTQAGFDLAQRQHTAV